jgi:amino acid permease
MYLEAIFFVYVTFMLGTSIPNVEVVFAFVGGTFSACTNFIFPALFYLKLRHEDPKPTYLKTYGASAMFVFGILVAVMTTVLIIVKYV